MNLRRIFPVLAFLFLVTSFASAQDYLHETKEQRDARMKWWREARFGLFIHWGLYSIPAGEWKGGKDHAEWIRTTAEIPLKEYDKFQQQFNPVKFNADEWVKMAKAAGMQYVVITSKHHDGFCMFDTKQTDFNVMNTPFHRDPMKELAAACQKEGLTFCFYHSIMDWHHPDYLPRRTWEKDRPTEGADINRYATYMKSELRELLTNYGPIGVLWFDGEWETATNPNWGNSLYAYVRTLQPNIIINNRVGNAREENATTDGGEKPPGDFETPEQEIPATGLPGVDWETCMTMNDHWGYNKYDTSFKSSKDLLQKLADIASKGGNFLLNIGPTSEGVFPPKSIERLHDIGNWMSANSEAIYATTASPFRHLDWGRCTQKPITGGTRFYLHVFEWPADGRLVIPGIFNESKNAFLLSDKSKSPLSVSRQGIDLLISGLPAMAPDTNNSVVVLDVDGAPDVSNPPSITSEYDRFADSLAVTISTGQLHSEIHYTLDGSLPTKSSPVVNGLVILKQSALVTACAYRDGKRASETTVKRFTKIELLSAQNVKGLSSGVAFKYFEGSWDSIPDFSAMTPVKLGTTADFSLAPKARPEDFGFEYDGYIRIPADGTYLFSTESDDGSKLYIDGDLVVNNDYLHGMSETKGVTALRTGLHRIRVDYFQKKGDVGLRVYYKNSTGKRTEIGSIDLFSQK